MSVPLINRSLTTIRTELEFLHDSEVITDQLYNRLLQSIPTRYQKDMKPWDVNKLDVSNNTASDTDKLVEDLSNVNISSPSYPPRTQGPKPLGYCKALYDYQSQEPDDLILSKDDKVAILEHLSEDWWKGYKQNSTPDRAGVFPSNYVKVISQQEFELTSSRTPPPPPPEKIEKHDEKASYQSPQYSAPPPQYVQPLQQEPSYGGYAQYPPVSTNYYPPQQNQQQPAQQAAVVEQSPHGSHLKKFGSKLGNAAIFGAGATIGSDIVNSIF